MLDLNEVQEQINRREMGDTSWANCQALAILYSILDHHSRVTVVQKSSETSGSPSTGDLGTSEFLQAASGVSIGDLMTVLDEHMEALKVVFPKEYESVISKIRAIR